MYRNTSYQLDLYGVRVGMMISALALVFSLVEGNMFGALVNGGLLLAGVFSDRIAAEIYPGYRVNYIY